MESMKTAKQIALLLSCGAFALLPAAAHASSTLSPRSAAAKNISVSLFGAEHKDEGKCGEGKCGDDKKAPEDKCSGDKKCSADKDGHKHSDSSEKCGAGKCGSDKK